MSDLIDRQAALKKIGQINGILLFNGAILINYLDAEKAIEDLPSAQSETCEGCKHLGKWVNEIEYGYSSPCTRCKRRVEDNYER